MRVLLSLVSVLLITLSASAACYDTPGGMTVCPPTDNHLGTDNIFIQGTLHNERRPQLGRSDLSEGDGAR